MSDLMTIKFYIYYDLHTVPTLENSCNYVQEVFVTQNKMQNNSVRLIEQIILL